MSKIAPCLWFDGQAEEAARFYTSLLPDSHIDKIKRAPGDYPSGKKGDVLLVEFTLAGQPYTGLNGGPHFKFNEAISLQILCDSQQEVDHYWKALAAGGPVEAQQCGWVKDRFGLSWQIVPKAMIRMMDEPDPAKAQRVWEAMMQMKRIDIAALERAAECGR